MEEFAARLYNSENQLTTDFLLFANLKNWNPYSDYTFWLRVLRDHMMFINQKLSIDEIQLKENSLRLLVEGEELHRIAFQQYQNPDFNKLTSFNNDVLIFISKVKNIKQNILNLQLNNLIKISLTPTIISHMLNELETFELIAKSVFNTGQMPPIILMNHHKLWISDMIGHLDAIKCDLDGVEKMLRVRVKKNKKGFEMIYSKVLEFINYVKHGIVEFPALQKLTKSSAIETMIYLSLLHEIYEMVNTKAIVSRLDSDFLLHMIFEEIYYMVKLPETVPGFVPN